MARPAASVISVDRSSDDLQVLAVANQLEFAHAAAGIHREPACAGFADMAAQIRFAVLEFDFPAARSGAPSLESRHAESKRLGRRAAGTPSIALVPWRSVPAGRRAALAEREARRKEQRFRRQAEYRASARRARDRRSPCRRPPAANAGCVAIARSSGRLFATPNTAVRSRRCRSVARAASRSGPKAMTFAIIGS